jgi:hypothetical protein
MGFWRRVPDCFLSQSSPALFSSLSLARFWLRGTTTNAKLWLVVTLYMVYSFSFYKRVFSRCVTLRLLFFCAAADTRYQWRSWCWVVHLLDEAVCENAARSELAPLESL